MGVAFDGDGDRAIFVDAGQGRHGDAVLLMCGRPPGRGRLKGTRSSSPPSRQHRTEPRHPSASNRAHVGRRQYVMEMIAGLVAWWRVADSISSRTSATGDGLCTHGTCCVRRVEQADARRSGGRSHDLPRCCSTCACGQSGNSRAPTVAGQRPVESRVADRGACWRYSGTGRCCADAQAESGRFAPGRGRVDVVKGTLIKGPFVVRRSSFDVQRPTFGVRVPAEPRTTNGERRITNDERL
jgi:hypothetical protein